MNSAPYQYGGSSEVTSLASPTEPIPPKQRALLLEGPASQVIGSGNAAKERYLFLFNDVLVITKLVHDNHDGDPAVLVKVVTELWRVSVGPYTEKNAWYSNLDHPFLGKIIRQFNDGPAKCIGWLLSNSVVQSTSSSIAFFLHGAPGLIKREVSRILTANENTSILKAYFAQFDFSVLPRLDDAIRVLLMSFPLPQDAVALDHMLQLFAEVWVSDVKSSKKTEKSGLNTRGMADPLVAGIADRPKTPASVVQVILCILSLNGELHASSNRWTVSSISSIMSGSGPPTSEDFQNRVSAMVGPDNTPSRVILDQIYQSVKNYRLLMIGEDIPDEGSAPAGVFDQYPRSSSSSDAMASNSPSQKKPQWEIDFYCPEAEGDPRPLTKTGGIPNRMLSNGEPIAVTVSFRRTGHEYGRSLASRLQQPMPEIRLALLGRDLECRPPILSFTAGVSRTGQNDMVTREFFLRAVKQGYKGLYAFPLPPIVSGTQPVAVNPHVVFPYAPRSRAITVDPQFKRNLFRLNVEGQGMAQTKKFTLAVASAQMRDMWWTEIDTAATECWKIRQREKELEKERERDENERRAAEQEELRRERLARMEGGGANPQLEDEGDLGEPVSDNEDVEMFPEKDKKWRDGVGAKASGSSDVGSASDIMDGSVLIHSSVAGDDEDEYEWVYDAVEDEEYVRRTPRETRSVMPWAPGEVMKRSVLMKRAVRKLMRKSIIR
ncbi:Sec7 domain-containing protein [Cladochytrium replicatum]|nr:Sec7 domain-containing protein [Cladochytrium replicatum]